MKFPLFSHRASQPATQDVRNTADTRHPDAERTRLTATLYSLLESLPQSYSGRENLRRLCQTLLAASSRLHFVWIGFCEGGAEWVEPYAAAGVQECSDWCLPQTAFEASGAYSQRAPTAAGQNGDRLLFAPWRHSPTAVPAGGALAFPLRTERPEMRGMMVFYADTADYFAQPGAESFQAFCHVAEMIWKQSDLLNMLTQKAQLDGLTGTMTRRRTMYVLERAVEHATRAEEPMSLLICRLEGFSKINDLYGWMAADAILAAAVREMTAQLRPHDKIGRWTGVEFLCVLANTGAGECAAKAVALQEYFLTHPINVRNWSLRLTLVTGAATLDGQSISVDELIQQANRSLLNAA